MLFKVFSAQIRNPTKGDWPQLVNQDLKDFNINLSFDQIKIMKSAKFKKVVKEACKSYTFKLLMKDKEKHKKGSKIIYNILEMQTYLKTDKITTKEAKLLFKIRTDMIEVKKNYKNKYINKNNEPEVNERALLCPLCQLHIDSAEKIFICSVLNDQTDNDKNDLFDKLFSKDMKVVATSIKQFSKLWKMRQQKLEKK